MEAFKERLDGVADSGTGKEGMEEEEEEDEEEKEEDKEEEEGQDEENSEKDVEPLEKSQKVPMRQDSKPENAYITTYYV
jgi:hypothetical protein